MVSVDDAETNKKFATEHDADFPILSDPEKGVATSYGVLGQTGLLLLAWSVLTGVGLALGALV